MFFTEKVEPRLNDFDAAGFLSYEAILQILENLSAHHALTVNDRVSGAGIAWILVDWRVEILSRPKQFQKLNATTWVRKTPPSGTTYRDFKVTDDKGNLLIKASSRFALINTGTGRMTRISAELMDSYGPENDSAFEEDRGRLSEPDTFDREAPIVLRKTDIDYNGHVHNTRYVDFALDALTEEDFKKDYDHLRIAYRSAISFDSQPVIRHSSWKDGHFFCIYAEDRLCTMIELR